MAEEPFIDYFDLAHLDPNVSREDNYLLLEKKHRENTGRFGAKGELEAAILGRAMEIFKNPVQYAAFRKQWELRHASKPDFQPDRAAAVNEEPSAGTPQQGAQKGFWSVVGKVVATAGKNYLESKAASENIGLSGRWTDNMGCFLQVRQAGENITVAVRNSLGLVVSEGRGVIRGNMIDYEARDLAGQLGRGTLRVSPDGMHLDGEITWYNPYSNVPAGSGRFSFIRS